MKLLGGKVQVPKGRKDTIKYMELSSLHYFYAKRPNIRPLAQSQTSWQN